VPAAPRALMSCDQGSGIRWRSSSDLVAML
jgi:hypothetical protein